MTDGLKREVEITQAYDYRATRPGGGQHCVDFTFYIKGPLGVVQFRLFTGWYKSIIGPPDTDWRELHVSTLRNNPGSLWEPMPADLGYHSPAPRYEGQAKMDQCSVLDQGHCYYDGSTLNAGRIFSLMVHEGGEAMWKALEDYYHQTFDEETVAREGNNG